MHELFRDVLRFWLDRGVDGFRIDVAHGMVKPEGLPDATISAEGLVDIPEGEAPIYFDNDGVLDIYREWRPIVDSYDGDRMMVLEAWIPEHRVPLYIGPAEAHQAFSFGFLQATWDAGAMRAAIEGPLDQAGAVGAPTTWVLSNHDLIRHATRYGFATDYRFGEGLARHERPDAELGLQRARAVSLVMLALPGSAYLYQGEELGLPEVSEIPDELRQDPAHKRAGVPGRDGCRVPLPWERDSPAFGFSITGKSWLPQPSVFGDLAVDAPEGVEGSTLEMYRSALRVRRRYGLGRAGEPIDFVEEVPEGVLALAHGSVVVIVNTTDAPIDLAELPGRGRATVLVSSSPIESNQLPANTAAWLA